MSKPETGLGRGMACLWGDRGEVTSSLNRNIPPLSPHKHANAPPLLLVSIKFIDGHMCYQAPTYHITYAVCNNANKLIDTLTGAILNMNVFHENIEY